MGRCPDMKAARTGFAACIHSMGPMMGGPSPEARKWFEEHKKTWDAHQKAGEFSPGPRHPRHLSATR